jgi:hypothetical protein
MKTELAISATKNFVTEDWQLLVIVSTMKSDGQFVLIPVGLSTSNELTACNDEVTGINGHRFFITELYSTFDND